MAFIIPFRILDEVFYPNYRKTKIDKPLFIISNPRSGTTFLHRLLSLDDEKYYTTKLWHTIYQSVIIIKFFQLIGRIDAKLGGGLKKFLLKIDAQIFKGWDDMHRTGLFRTEEDEAYFAYQLTTPSIFLLCPFINEIHEVKLADKLDEKTRHRMKAFYVNSIQRFSYAIADKNQHLLAKNVLSTGRIKSILETFPDARIIYIVRHPYDAIPSFISMFSAPWTFHSPEIAENSEQYRAWGKIAIDFYKYFAVLSKEIKNDHLYVVKYDDLIENPKQIVQDIYANFDLEVGKQFENNLNDFLSTQRNYESKHDYSLENYGFTKEYICNELLEVFEEYSFAK